MKIANTLFSLDFFNADDLFICALGYETRSFSLLKNVLSRINRDNILIFLFPSLIEARKEDSCVADIKSRYAGARFVNASYEDKESALNKILLFIQEKIKESSTVRIHVDYSSMPRGWYCRMPESITEILSADNNLYFWYVDGKYPISYKNYPSAGIGSFEFFSGQPTLRTNKKRMHIISLSYDVVRTQATISWLDPDSFIACVAYDSRNPIIRDNVLQINKDIITHASMRVVLRMNDFESMIAKLSELANENVSDGDVVFIPDGPKPLIFAESLVPILLQKKGISCLHIRRNIKFFNPVEVLPTDNIIGFNVLKE